MVAIHSRDPYKGRSSRFGLWEMKVSDAFRKEKVAF
jgi:hypothetical protein